MTDILRVAANKFYPLLILTGICVIICIGMLFVIGTQFICGFDICLTQINHRQPIKYVRYFSFFSLFSFIICLISQIYIIKSLDADLNIPNYEWQQDIITSVNTISWAFGQLCIYLLFVLNLHFTFKNTLLALSKRVLIFLYILIILFFILQLSFTVLFIIYYNLFISDAQFSMIAMVIVSVTVFNDIILSFALVYLFVNKLFKLFVLTLTHENHSKLGPYDVSKEESKSSWLIQAQKSLAEELGVEAVRVSKNKKDVGLNVKQESILNTASKYAILSSIAIISTQLYLISQLNNVISINGSQDYYNWSFRIYTALLSLDCFINSLCIFLNFEFNQLCFLKCCCLCDSCCHSICRCISKRYYQKGIQA